MIMGMSNIADPDPDNDPQTAEPSQDWPAQRFGWSNMFVHPDNDPRSDGGFKDERSTLVGQGPATFADVPYSR